MRYATIGAMGKATRANKQAKIPPETDAPRQTTEQQPAKSADSELEWLYSLDEGTEIMVTRKAPSCAEGFIGNIQHDPKAPEGVLERIRAKWGGGRFLLQPKRRQKNGHRYFTGGSAQVTIAGEPMLDGRGYDEHGRHLPKPTAPAPAYPQYPQYPQQPAAPPVAPASGMAPEVLGLVERALNKGGSSQDLAGVITALQGMHRDPVPLPAPVRVNTMADMKQMLEMMTLMRAGVPDNSESPATPSDPMEKLLQFAALKFMGGADANANPTTAPVNSSGPGPQPSPKHVWHPAHGWVVWQSHAAEGRSPPTRPTPPAEPPGNPPPRPDTPTAGGDASTPDSAFTPPIQPDELIGELEAKTPEQQAEFIKSVLAMIEQRPDLARSFMSVAEAAKKAGEPPTPGDGGLSAVQS